MEIEDIKKDLIKICSVAIVTSSADGFESNFPALAKWSSENVNQDDINQIVKDMVDLVKMDDHVSITKDDFITLYSYVQAVIGFEETKTRFPKLRLLALNLMSTEELKSTLMLIDQIEKSLQEKFNQQKQS